MLFHFDRFPAFKPFPREFVDAHIADSVAADKWLNGGGNNVMFMYETLAQLRFVLVEDAAIDAGASLMELGGAMCDQLGIEDHEYAATLSKKDYVTWVMAQMREAEDRMFEDMACEMCEIPLSDETKVMFWRVMSPEVRGLYKVMYHALHDQPCGDCKICGARVGI
jgi:hypothetical protein